MNKLISSILAACLLAMPAATSAATTIPLDDSFEVGGTNWRGGGQTLILFKVVEMGGKIGACGIYVNRGNVPGNVDRQLMRNAKLRVNGKTVMSVNHFPRIRENDENVAARCKASRKPWKGTPKEAEIRFNANGTYSY